MFILTNYKLSKYWIRHIITSDFQKIKVIPLLQGVDFVISQILVLATTKCYIQARTLALLHELLENCYNIIICL